MKRSVVFIGLSLLLGLAFAAESDCPFIAGGAIHEIAGDSSDVSAALALSGGGSTDVSGESALEARFRTWDESEGVMIQTDKFPALMIILR